MDIPFENWTSHLRTYSNCGFPSSKSTHAPLTWCGRHQSQLMSTDRNPTYVSTK